MLYYAVYEWHYSWCPLLNSASQTMSSGDSKKTEVMVCLTGGRLFHTRAATMKNTQSPSIKRLVGLTTIVGEAVDRK